ncbi:MAG: DedA family protein [bacterium]
MLDYFYFALPVVIEYRYLAVFLALTVAGLGVPIPEELSIVVSGYMVATGRMEFWFTFVVCYAGVLAGDLVTYALGRFGGRIFLGSRFLRIFISKRRLGQAQYYYRRYGPRSLLVARQAPGLRFPSFFTAGLLKMNLSSFLKYDCFAALISMPLAYLLAYYFGPSALNYIVRIGNITTLTVLVFLLLAAVITVVYSFRRRKKTGV